MDGGLYIFEFFLHNGEAQTCPCLFCGEKRLKYFSEQLLGYTRACVGDYYLNNMVFRPAVCVNMYLSAGWHCLNGITEQIKKKSPLTPLHRQLWGEGLEGCDTRL